MCSSSLSEEEEEQLKESAVIFVPTRGENATVLVGPKKKETGVWTDHHTGNGTRRFEWDATGAFYKPSQCVCVDSSGVIDAWLPQLKAAERGAPAFTESPPRSLFTYYRRKDLVVADLFGRLGVPLQPDVVVYEGMVAELCGRVGDRAFVQDDSYVCHAILRILRACWDRCDNGVGGVDGEEKEGGEDTGSENSEEEREEAGARVGRTRDVTVDDLTAVYRCASFLPTLSRRWVPSRDGSIKYFAVEGTVYVNGWRIPADVLDETLLLPKAPSGIPDKLWPRHWQREWDRVNREVESALTACGLRHVRDCAHVEHVIPDGGQRYSAVNTGVWIHAVARLLHRMSGGAADALRSLAELTLVIHDGPIVVKTSVGAGIASQVNVPHLYVPKDNRLHVSTSQDVISVVLRGLACESFLSSCAIPSGLLEATIRMLSDIGRSFSSGRFEAALRDCDGLLPVIDTLMTDAAPSTPESDAVFTQSWLCRHYTKAAPAAEGGRGGASEDADVPLLSEAERKKLEEESERRRKERQPPAIFIHTGVHWTKSGPFAVGVGGGGGGGEGAVKSGGGGGGAGGGGGGEWNNKVPFRVLLDDAAVSSGASVPEFPVVSPDELAAIGRWGESVCTAVLTQQYPTATVNWVNAAGETGAPYDVILSLPGKPEVFVEIKTARLNDSSFTAHFSPAEQQYAALHRDRYWLVCVLYTSGRTLHSVQLQETFAASLADHKYEVSVQFRV